MWGNISLFGEYRKMLLHIFLYTARLLSLPAWDIESHFSYFWIFLGIGNGKYRKYDFTTKPPRWSICDDIYELWCNSAISSFTLHNITPLITLATQYEFYGGGTNNNITCEKYCFDSDLPWLPREIKCIEKRLLSTMQ